MTTLATATGEEEGEGEQGTGEEVGRRGLYQMSKRNYMYRETNYEIGRAAEKAKVSVPRYKPKDWFKGRKWRNSREGKEYAKSMGFQKGGRKDGRKEKK